MTTQGPVEVDLFRAILSAVAWAVVFVVLAWLVSRRHRDC